MFSFLKRLTGFSTDDHKLSRDVRSHQIMPNNLQLKFSKGINYNMKIIIKGDKCTGKTCLFERLQGKKFIVDYKETEEIQVESIHWKYKNTDDIVKVEIWEIVDKSLKKNISKGTFPALDAQFIDVYKGCNAIIFIFDISKQSTFSYIERELIKIPKQIPVLIMGNCCDKSHHREVPMQNVISFIESLKESFDAPIRYTDSSMINGFGLNYVHKFFSIPFLILQKKCLMSKLENNEKYIELSTNELNSFEKSPDGDYNIFLEKLIARRTKKAVNQSSEQFAVSSKIIGRGKPHAESILKNTAKLKKIEDFVCVSDGSLTKFLCDDSINHIPNIDHSNVLTKSPNNDDEESEDESGVNPLVAVYEDYIESGKSWNEYCKKGNVSNDNCSY